MKVPKILPTEFAINMSLEKMLVLQQADLEFAGKLNYFDEKNPCHIYFICKRPRLTINPEKCVVDRNCIKLFFVVQKKDQYDEFECGFQCDFGSEDIKLISQYPYNFFELIKDGEVLFDAKVGAFVHEAMRHKNVSADFLDLEVLYIGQSFGVDGARTAPDRLKNHSTLQGIYAEAITNNPDCEIWLALASFEQINIAMFPGFVKFTEQELEEDDARRPFVLDKLHREGLSEQQKINFTEAALIKYFQPKYNSIYKNTFPNPAHQTYRECYDLDINSICIEMQTAEMINCCMYSETVERAPWNIKTFFLHSSEERKNMFDIFNT